MNTKKFQFLSSILILALTSVALLVIIQRPYSLELKINVLITAALIYIIWAFTNHKFDKSLTIIIFLEYLLTGILVFVLFMGLIS